MADKEPERPPQLNYRRLTRLYCMNDGYHLQILADGRVRGQRDENDPYIVLHILSVDPAVVVIQGTESQKYLAMDAAGRLYGSDTPNFQCRFLEKVEENNYSTFQSVPYLAQGWYVGLKKNGNPKSGPKTRLGQYAVFFLPRQVDNLSE